MIGATCTLKPTNGGQSKKVETDAFGDFWFHGLADGRTYSLTIEKDGKTKNFDRISTAADTNLGDIPMRL